MHACKLPLKLVVPITDWKEYFKTNLWHIYLKPDAKNGLTKESAADVLQTRSIDLKRCICKLGIISSNTVQEIATAIANLIEYEEMS